MCGTKISYACSTTLISQSTTCSCAKVIACGKSTLYCGTCNHPRCKELRSESSVTTTRRRGLREPEQAYKLASMEEEENWRPT
ncbi:hypothetical protein QR685DRAFT_575726 [Neurospora intermedia]|uniref:Uncharacterized protein n=1 Tax=Neurospora intermedia TaxID=5142 RepID=A0ABR3D1F7_NEUIN